MQLIWEIFFAKSLYWHETRLYLRDATNMRYKKSMHCCAMFFEKFVATHFLVHMFLTLPFYLLFKAYIAHFNN